MELIRFLVILSLTATCIQSNRHHHGYYNEDNDQAETNPTHPPLTHRPHRPYPTQPTHPTHAPERQSLNCYSCNENQAACSVPTLDLDHLNIEHYVPCNGQCMQYQNRWDNYKWYRGCSWDMDFGNGVARQPDVLEHQGNTFYFCDTNGCNILDISTVHDTARPTDHIVGSTHEPIYPTDGYHEYTTPKPFSPVQTDQSSTPEYYTPHHVYPSVYTPHYTKPEQQTTVRTTTVHTTTMHTTTMSTTQVYTTPETSSYKPYIPVEPVYTPEYTIGMPYKPSHTTAHFSITPRPMTYTPHPPLTHRPHRPYPTQPTHPTHAPERQPLNCYSCNENQAACSVPTLDLDHLNIEHYVPCNGQCMQYQNRWDNYKWYRGCSWDMDFGNGVARQPDVLEHQGNTYYFCDTNGCNIKDINNDHRPSIATEIDYIPTQPPHKSPYKEGKIEHNQEVASLYCFDCNENLPACSIPTLNVTTLLKNYLTPCHGQCMQYQNQFDNNKWYRGCSTQMDFGNANVRHDPILVHKGTFYFFCETFGCNLGNIGNNHYYNGKIFKIQK